MKGDAVGDAEFLRHRLVFGAAFRLADQIGADAHAVAGLQPRDGVKQYVDTLEIAKGAEEKQVARIGLRLDRHEFVLAEPVWDDSDKAMRGANLAAIGVGLELADVDDRVGIALQEPLGGEIDAAVQCWRDRNAGCRREACRPAPRGAFRRASHRPGGA